MLAILNLKHVPFILERLAELQRESLMPFSIAHSQSKYMLMKGQEIQIYHR
jgi:hypothetical protein